MDLSNLLSKTGCECLNESDEHTLEHALNPDGGYLESDCDEQVNSVYAYIPMINYLHYCVCDKNDT